MNAKGRAKVIMGVSEAKLCKKSHVNIFFCITPHKSDKNSKTLFSMWFVSPKGCGKGVRRTDFFFSSFREVGARTFCQEG